MKVVVIALAMLAVAGCTSNQEYEDSFQHTLDRTPGLQDCKFFYVKAADVTASMSVIRCPNSNVVMRVPAGKHYDDQVIIDGVPYVRAPQPSVPDQ